MRTSKTADMNQRTKQIDKSAPLKNIKFEEFSS